MKFLQYLIGLIAIVVYSNESLARDPSNPIIVLTFASLASAFVVLVLKAQNEEPAEPRPYFNMQSKCWETEAEYRTRIGGQGL